MEINLTEGKNENMKKHGIQRMSLFIFSGYSVHQWSWRPVFNPRSRHTKGFKNGT